jgi:signal transduction histidine kinase
MAVTLLLVEDDIVDRTAVKRALKAAGVEATIREVDDADAALAVLQGEPIDCVLLDYRLPKGDGLELLKRARSLGLLTPFIALTGQGDEQLAAEMMRSGASDYLPKQSLTPDRLERSLRHALAIGKAEEERRLLLAREQAAREAAQEANRAKDEFLATLSHELRTPLNAILGWARMLAAGTLDGAKAARAIQTIERNAHVQARLIEDLLDISRVATGKLQVTFAPADLAALLESVVDSLRPNAAAKGIALVSGPCEACQIMADASRIQQVVGNLITNAIKFTPAGGVVTVSLRLVNDTAVITVHDTGIGLDAAFVPHMFERFRQADSGTTREHGGLGLGLAIVQHLVRLHGGEVVAASDGRDRGSTFTVSLPIVADARRVEDAVTPSTAMPSLNGIHILCVDDDEDALGLIEAMLSDRGARVTTARSVADALAALDREPPDLLISDIAMPGDDGYALIRAVRNSPSAAVRDLPAAAVTAFATAVDRSRAVLAGFQSHLPKPIDPHELAALVATLVARKTAPPIA